MLDKWLLRARSEEGERQMANTAVALLIAIGLAIVIGGVGHVYAVVQ